MRHAVLVIFSYVVLFLGIGTAVHLLTISKLEHKLEQATALALRTTLDSRAEGVELDLHDLQVKFAGFHGKVFGAVPDQETYSFVEHAIAAINHGDVAETRMIVSLSQDLRLRARCHLFVKNDNAYVRGFMSPGMVRELQAAVKMDLVDASSANGEVGESTFLEFRQDDAAEEPRWGLPMCEFLKDYLPVTRQADFSINDKVVMIGGLVSDQTDKEAIEASAHELLSNLVPTIDTSALEVDVPVIPSHISIETDANGIVSIVGQVTNNEIADQIIDSVQRSLQSYQALSNNITLQKSPPVAPPDWIENFEGYTRQLFATVSYPHLLIDGDRVVITGQVTDLGTAEELCAKTSTQFPGQTLVNQLSLPSNELTQGLAHLEKTVSATDVLFDVNQSSIKASEAPKLKALAALLKQAPTTEVVIFGFADPTGDADANLRLSLLRCQAARDRLIQLGVSASKLEIVKRGVDTTIAGTDPEALQQGRRVEFELKASAE